MVSEQIITTEFQSAKISFVETINVTEGVDCDSYIFQDDETKDLGIIRVAKGCSTPLQRVLQGESTIEGYLDGIGALHVIEEDGKVNKYDFAGDEAVKEIEVTVGQTMQWIADPDSDLTFYEICTPPYQDGRFENLTS